VIVSRSPASHRHCGELFPRGPAHGKQVKAPTPIADDVTSGDDSSIVPVARTMATLGARSLDIHSAGILARDRPAAPASTRVLEEPGSGQLSRRLSGAPQRSDLDAHASNDRGS
jgi:hypothetical protein